MTRRCTCCCYCCCCGGGGGGTLRLTFPPFLPSLGRCTLYLFQPCPMHSFREEMRLQYSIHDSLEKRRSVKWLLGNAEHLRSCRSIYSTFQRFYVPLSPSHLSNSLFVVNFHNLLLKHFTINQGQDEGVQPFTTPLNPPAQTSNSTPLSTSPTPATHGAKTTRIQRCQCRGAHSAVTSPSSSYSSCPLRAPLMAIPPETVPLNSFVGADVPAAEVVKARSLIRVIRQAIWLAHTRPRLGVLRLGCRLYGSSPQPVKKRCWWSRLRT